MYEKKIIDLEEVTHTLLPEERRMSGESTEATNVLTLAILGNWKKDNSKNKRVCWGCEQLGHLKKDYHRRNQLGPTSGSKIVLTILLMVSYSSSWKTIVPKMDDEDILMMCR